MCQAFAYDDDFELPTTPSADIQLERKKNIRCWCEENEMKLSENTD